MQVHGTTGQSEPEKLAGFATTKQQTFPETQPWLQYTCGVLAEEGESLTLKNLASGNYAYTRKDSKYGLNNKCISYDPSFANYRTINHHSST